MSDDLVKRLRAAIHLESAAISPQTTPLMEYAREAADRIEALEKEKRWIIEGRDRDFAAILARLNNARREALEEAALLVDSINSNWPPYIAAAIRALKDGAEEVHRSRGGNCGPGPSTSDNAFFVREEE